MGIVLLTSFRLVMNFSQATNTLAYNYGGEGRKWEEVKRIRKGSKIYTYWMACRREGDRTCSAECWDDGYQVASKRRGR